MPGSRAWPRASPQPTETWTVTGDWISASNIPAAYCIADLKAAGAPATLAFHCKSKTGTLFAGDCTIRNDPDINPIAWASAVYFSGVRIRNPPWSDTSMRDSFPATAAAFNASRFAPTRASVSTTATRATRGSAAIAAISGA